MVGSVVASSEFSSFASLSYERNVQIDAALNTKNGEVAFSASVDVSISLEARATLQTEAIGRDLSALAQRQGGASDLLGGIADNVVDVLSAVANGEISSEAGIKLLDAGDELKAALEEVLEASKDGSLESDDLERLVEAAKAFREVAGSVGGAPQVTQRSAASVAASFEISISLEARATFQTESISRDVNALPRGRDGAGARVGEIAKGVTQALARVAKAEVGREAGNKVLDAGDDFKDALRDLLGKAEDRPLERKDVHDLAKAGRAVRAAAHDALGAPARHG